MGVLIYRSLNNSYAYQYDNNIIISDPIGGTIKYQSRSVFEARYNYYGKRALYYL